MPRLRPAPDDDTMRQIKAMGAPPSNRMPVPPPMAAPVPVESFDLTRNFGPSPSLVTGERRPSVNTNGRMGMPQLDAVGDRIGSRGMTTQRLAEIAQRRLGSAMRGGDMNAAAMLYRGGMGGFGGRGFGPVPAMRGQPPQPSFGAPQPPPTTANNSQPLPTPLDPLANLPPPATTEEALGMPGFGPVPAASGEAPSMPMMPARMPWEGQPLPGMAPGLSLPPSTMNGGAGLPPPPRFSEYPVGGMTMIVDNDTGKQVQGYKPEPQQPPPLSAEELGRIRAGGFAPVQVGGRSFDAQGVPYLEPLPTAPEPTEKVTEGPSGTTRTYTQPRTAAPAAPPPPANAQPGIKTPSGNQFRRADSASTQTGQMPNEAYASPLSPEQLLEQARNEYARTGSDAALKQYFAQYPSEAVRLNQQEQQIWQQVAGQVDRLGRAASNRGDAQDARNAYIDRFSGPFTQGAIDAEFAQNFPGAMRAINGPLPMPDVNLIGTANDLSRRAAAAAGRTMPAMAPRVPLQPMAPPLPIMIAERNPQGVVARLNQLPTLPAFMRPNIRR